MRKWKLFTKIQNYLHVFFASLTLAFIILLFVFKDSLNELASQSVRSQIGAVAITSQKAIVDSLFNYQKNGLSYSVTFLEFGATGCSSCRQMEQVMEDIREQYPLKVQVVFLNILKPENQEMMKYYGIAAIPTQVLLDNEGIEYFRHTGYLPTNQLIKELFR
ncbi:MAG: thioredoxin family protein [Salinivirgaceae bacterium]|nr:thioredoxin family protein [Salinivirgaceae bacterium]